MLLGVFLDMVSCPIIPEEAQEMAIHMKWVTLWAFDSRYFRVLPSRTHK